MEVLNIASTGIVPGIFPALSNSDTSRSSSDALSVEIPIHESASEVFAFAALHNVSPQTVIQVLWALVLRCYIGSNAVSFGSLVFEQKLNTEEEGGIDESEDVLFAISTYIEETDLVSEFLSRVQSAPTRYHHHQDESSPFNTILIHQNQPRISMQDSKRVIDTEDHSTYGVDKYDVVVLVEYSADHLSMKIAFSSLKFSEDAALNVAHTCGKILESLINPANQAVEDLVTLSDRDYAQILSWNPSSLDRIDACVHHVFQQRVQAAPDSPAVCAWDGTLTYSNLDKLSSKLAHHLCKLGAGPEVIVPFCFEKSMWAIVATMAILKSGSAFVPLDPSHPRSRLELIIQEVGAKLVLASPSCLHMLEGLARHTVTVSESEIEGLEDETGEPAVNVGPQNTAFVLFTSGSTGRPKGVIQEHAAVCTISQAYSEALHLTSSSRVLQFAAYTFDVSTVDIFTTLTRGGCVCVPSEYERKHDLLRAMNEMKVTWADLTPSFVSLFGPEDVPTLETLVLAGEEVKQEHVMRWATKLRLINCYGPAECGGCTTNIYLNSNSRPETIGRSIKCTNCWVVTEGNPGRLASIGAVGELIVEGPTLTRGYFNNAEKSKAAFIENPAWLRATDAVPKRRFYRTGDLVHYRTDGLLNFVGRRDTQIKIRGQRVELGEAEHHLSDHPAITKCLIVFPKTGSYSKRLVAVLQLRGLAPQLSMDDNIQLASTAQIQSMGFDPCEAADGMKNHLPSYMIPTAWVVVENIPLTTSKKMDRRRVETWLADLGLEHILAAAKGSSGEDRLTLLSSDMTIALKVSSKVADIVANGNMPLKEALHGYDFSLSAVGLDSIQMITLSRWISREFVTKINIEKLTDTNATIGSLAGEIQRTQNSTLGEAVDGIPSLDIWSELENLSTELLTSNFKPNASGSKATTLGDKDLFTVFMTGATGFLGTQILRKLVSNAEIGKIIVHVRGNSPKHGLQRIVDAARSAKWWSDHFTSKLEVWPGDLAAPQLGLSKEQWSIVTGDGNTFNRIHAVIHNGASVRWNSDYGTLKGANVRSTFQLLHALSLSSHPMHFVYISGGQQLSLSNEEDYSTIASLVSKSTGYAQTKLVSELLIRDFASHQGIAAGHNISIVKPSYIIGSALDGVANTTDYLWRLVAGAMQIGAYPISSSPEDDSWLFVAPVDRVADAVLQCLSSTKLEDSLRTIKVLDGLPIKSFWATVVAAFSSSNHVPSSVHGYSPGTFWRTLRNTVEVTGEKHLLWPLLYMLEDGRGEIGADSVIPTFEQVPMEVRLTVEEAVKRNVESLQSAGFFIQPQTVN